uniref:Uncharacterized protein n=1 Tax=Anopheles coluzzii TaxID=1518534 RepID=A0A8W7P825_ANOCL
MILEHARLVCRWSSSSSSYSVKFHRTAVFGNRGSGRHTEKREATQQQQQRVRVRRHKEGRSKCIFTVQDFGGLGARGQGSVGGDGSATAGEVAAGGGGAQRGTARSARRRCKVASGKRSAANQTMLKYLTHKLRTQSINDENQVNEKASQ